MKKIISILVAIALVGTLAACGNSETPVDNTDISDNTSVSEVQEQVLVDNDVIKVTFVEIFEEPSIPGTCYLRLKVENKLGQDITVYPKDGYVNDMAVTIGSGIPMDIVSGKSSQAPFFFNYSNIDIADIKDIETIELKVWVVNESFETLVETDSLTINIK